MKNPDESISLLIKILSDELQVHQSLIDAAKGMNEAIRSKDLKNLQAYTARYDALIGRLDDLEEQRLEACDSYAKAHTEHKHLTLIALLSLHTSEPQHSELVKIRSSIKDKIVELTKLNTSNHILLEASLAIIAKNFEIILKTQEKFQGYGYGGAPTLRNINRNFLNKIA